ncbi:hypothetical protein OJJOAM_003183 [Cupriavidus sp. H18C1]
MGNASTPSQLPNFDVAVVGGGLVGSAVAYGLRGSVNSIAVLDEGDVALRASRGNFGLVWLQSKGYGMGAYSRWTLGSVRLWPQLAAQLLAETGIEVALEQKGGLTPLMGDYEIEARLAWVNKLMSQPGVEPYEWKLLDHHQAASLVPGLGPDVTGAIWTPHDGIVNPLKLLRAFHIAFSQSDVRYLPPSRRDGHHAVVRRRLRAGHAQRQRARPQDRAGRRPAQRRTGPHGRHASADGAAARPDPGARAHAPPARYPPW